jgi:hypothetical protein
MHVIVDTNVPVVANQRQSPSIGQPGVGDAFLKWVLTNQANPQRCEVVELRLDDQGNCTDFPHDEALAGFDLSDRKFVAVALAHPNHPPILNASDTDWWHYRQALAGYGVEVDFLCPEEMTR